MSASPRVWLLLAPQKPQKILKPPAARALSCRLAGTRRPQLRASGRTSQRLGWTLVKGLRVASSASCSKIRRRGILGDSPRPPLLSAGQKKNETNNVELCATGGIFFWVFADPTRHSCKAVTEVTSTFAGPPHDYFFHFIWLVHFNRYTFQV